MPDSVVHFFIDFSENPAPRVLGGLSTAPTPQKHFGRCSAGLLLPNKTPELTRMYVISLLSHVAVNTRRRDRTQQLRRAIEQCDNVRRKSLLASVIYPSMEPRTGGAPSGASAWNWRPRVLLFNFRNTVALDCCRLGFQKIILLDYDVVDNHNLNRQILFSKKDVGRSKVEAAAEALEHHNIRYKLLSHRRSTIETVHLDAVQNWHRVVELARESTVIFNLVLSSC